MFAHDALAEMKNCTDLGKTSIWRSVMDLFLLFRAMVPSIHEKKIMTMPHVAMLHYNDCLYICHNLMILGHMYGQYLPHGQSDNLNTLMEMLRMAPAFRSMAGEVYVSEIRKQHKEIQNLLQDIDEENPTSRASEAKQGTRAPFPFAKVWSDILGKETLNQTLGVTDAKIPALFPDIMAYLNNNEHVKRFEMAKICRVSSHDSQSVNLASIRLLSSKVDHGVSLTIFFRLHANSSPKCLFFNLDDYNTQASSVFTKINKA